MHNAEVFASERRLHFVAGYFQYPQNHFCPNFDSHPLEDWQQESASALVKRLAVVAMAAALVWALQQSPSPEAAVLREELVRLSGRQMKRGRRVTAPALLSGLWLLLSAVELLERYTPDQLRALAQQASGFRS